MFGKLFAYAINLFARILGFIMRIDHSLDKEFEKIVISKYAGLGSIIQATPLIQTLRKNFPKAKLYFVSTEGNSVLLKHIPEIDELLLVSDENFLSVVKSSFRLIKTLWKIKPDLYIDLEFYSNYSGILTTLSKATNRLGFSKKSKAYRKGIYNYLVPFSVDSPISKTYLQFAELVNCTEIIRSLKIEIPDKAGERFNEKIGLTDIQNYIIVNPNASDLRIERRWPKESYIETIQFLLDNYPTKKIILIGNKIEADYVNEIVSALPAHPNLINSAGRLNLSELICLIAKATLMVTNDTGPMHIAFALHIKTISLFGPCSPLQYGHVSNSITFYKKVHCSPCVHTHLTPPCHGDNICMKNIKVEEVKRALSQSLD